MNGCKNLQTEVSLKACLQWEGLNSVRHTKSQVFYFLSLFAMVLFFWPFFRTLYSGVEFLLLLLFFERGAEARGTNCFRPELWRWWPESTPAVHPRGCTLYDLVSMLMHAWCIPMLTHVSKVNRTTRVQSSCLKVRLQAGKQTRRTRWLSCSC